LKASISTNAVLFRVCFVALSVVGCYGSSSLRVPVRSMVAGQIDCVDLADRVFFEAGYAKISGSTGAMVYTPRVAPATPSLMVPSTPFNWGIGVWKPERSNWTDTAGSCEYELQAISADPTCAVQCPPGPPMVLATDLARSPSGQGSCALSCPMTPQPGAQFDQATRDMAERLRAAGAATASTTRAASASLE
jgi:hypothetical protein